MRKRRDLLAILRAAAAVLLLLLLAPSSPARAQVAVVPYYDANNNGARDPGEPEVRGLTVTVAKPDTPAAAPAVLHVRVVKTYDFSVAADSSGLFHRASAGQATAPLPQTVVLHPAFPNPFNPATDIRFDLPQRAEISLRIFNLLGQSVKVLLAGHREAGTHHVRLEASELAAGAYFVVLEVGETVKRQRLLLLK